ncbi:MAG: helix-turn-helix transcriptional regulator [Propionicimonas sp.]
MDLNQAFSRVLRRVMRREGLSARRLAQETRMSPATVDRIVSGSQAVKLHQVDQLAEGLSVTPAELVAQASEVKAAAA